MKKLIILAGALMISVAVNAASCLWTGLSVAVPTGSTATDLTMYLMDNATTSLADMTAALDGGDTSKLAGNVTTTTGLAAGANARWTKTFGNYNAGDSFTYYTVILNKDGSQYMITPTMTAWVPSAGNMAMQFGSQRGNSWKPTTPIPEPTSALLLVLGMAGLALKRKIA